MDSLGKQIRAAREALGWSQVELASKIGASQSTVERIENGGALRSRFRHEAAQAVGIQSGVVPTPGATSSIDERKLEKLLTGLFALLDAEDPADLTETVLVAAKDGRPLPHDYQPKKDRVLLTIVGLLLSPGLKRRQTNSA